MKEYLPIRVQQRANPISVAKAGEWLVIMDHATGDRMRVHFNNLDDLESAIFEVKFAIKKQKEGEDV